MGTVNGRTTPLPDIPAENVGNVSESMVQKDTFNDHKNDAVSQSKFSELDEHVNRCMLQLDRFGNMLRHVRIVLLVNMVSLSGFVYLLVTR